MDELFTPTSEKLNYEHKDFFISWNHRDRSHLMTILDTIARTKGSDEGEITAWNSEFGGDCVGDLAPIISHNIPLCKAFLLIMSPNCLKSEWTLMEFIAAAKDPNIGINHILPVIVSETDFKKLDKWDPERYKDSPLHGDVEKYVSLLLSRIASMFSFDASQRDIASLIEKCRSILFNRDLLAIHSLKEKFEVKKFYPKLRLPSDLSDLYIHRRLVEKESSSTTNDDIFFRDLTEKDGQRALVVAKAGIGKTEFLKHLKNEINSVLENSSFFIPCREFAEKGLSLKAFLADHYSDRLPRDLLSSRVGAILEKRRITVLFDGFDEMIDDSMKEDFFSAFEKTIDAFPNLNYIFASRYAPSALLDKYGFKEFGLLGFDSEEVENYARALFLKIKGSKEEEFAPFYARIETINAEVKENPLFLSQLVCIYKLDAEVLESKVAILDRMASHLLDIDEENGVSGQADFIRKSMLEELLPYIAYQSSYGKAKGDPIYRFLFENKEKYGLSNMEERADGIRQYLDERSLLIDGQLSLAIFSDYYCAQYLFHNLYDERLAEFKETSDIGGILEKHDGDYALCSMFLCLLDRKLDEDSFSFALSKIATFQHNLEPYFDIAKIIAKKEITISVLLSSIVSKTMEGALPYYGDLFYIVGRYNLFVDVLKTGFPLLSAYGLRLLSLLRDLCYILDDFVTIDEVLEDGDLIKGYKKECQLFGKSYRNALNALFYGVDESWVEELIDEGNSSIHPFFWNLSLVKQGRSPRRMSEVALQQTFDDELKMFDEDQDYGPKGVLFLKAKEGHISLRDHNYDGVVAMVIDLQDELPISKESETRLKSIEKHYIKAFALNFPLSEKSLSMPLPLSFSFGRKVCGFNLFLSGPAKLSRPDFDAGYINEFSFSKASYFENPKFDGFLIKEMICPFESKRMNPFGLQNNYLIEWAYCLETLRDWNARTFIERHKLLMGDRFGERLMLWDFRIDPDDSIALCRHNNMHFVLKKGKEGDKEAYVYSLDYRSETIEIPAYVAHNGERYEVKALLRHCGAVLASSFAFSFQGPRFIDAKLTTIVLPGSIKDFRWSIFAKFNDLEKIICSEGVLYADLLEFHEEIEYGQTQVLFPKSCEIRFPSSLGTVSVDTNSELINRRHSVKVFIDRPFNEIEWQAEYIDSKALRFHIHCLENGLYRDKSETLCSLSEKKTDIEESETEASPQNCEDLSFRFISRDLVYYKKTLELLYAISPGPGPEFVLREYVSSIFEVLHNKGYEKPEEKLLIKVSSDFLEDISSFRKIDLSGPFGVEVEIPDEWDNPSLQELVLPLCVEMVTGESISSCRFPNLQKVSISTSFTTKLNWNHQFSLLPDSVFNHFGGALYVPSEDNPYFLLIEIEKDYYAFLGIESNVDVVLHRSLERVASNSSMKRLLSVKVPSSAKQSYELFDFLDHFYEVFFEEKGPLSEKYEERWQSQPKRNQAIHNSFDERRVYFEKPPFILRSDGCIVSVPFSARGEEFVIPAHITVTDCGEEIDIKITSIDWNAFVDSVCLRTTSLIVEAEIEEFSLYLLSDFYQLERLFLSDGCCNLTDYDQENNPLWRLNYLSIPEKALPSDLPLEEFVGYIDRRKEDSKPFDPIVKEGDLIYFESESGITLFQTSFDKQGNPALPSSYKDGTSVTFALNDHSRFLISNYNGTLRLVEHAMNVIPSRRFGNDVGTIIAPKGATIKVIGNDFRIDVLLMENHEGSCYSLFEVGPSAPKIGKIGFMQDGKIRYEEQLHCDASMKRVPDYYYHRIGSHQYRKIVFPQGLEEIGEECFCGLSLVQSITIPEGVTRIGSSFKDIKFLQTITLPKTLTDLGPSAFDGSEILEKVICPVVLEDCFDSYEPEEVIDLGEGMIEIHISKKRHYPYY